jgi:hypothetical protein
MRAWMPASLRPPQLRVLAREPAAELMMVKVLGPEADRVRLEPIMLWQSEVF